MCSSPNGRKQEKSEPGASAEHIKFTALYRHAAVDFKVAEVADVRVLELAKGDLRDNGRCDQLQQEELGKEAG